MNAIDIQSTLATVGKLEITEQTTNEDASTAMKILANFNQCAIGLVCFLGLTPWERHPDDEFLQILQGEVDVIILDDVGVREVTLHQCRDVTCNGASRRRRVDQPRELAFSTRVTNYR